MYRKGFTLVELLIVVGFLAVIATATVLILNPTEFLARSRDSKRFKDIETINKYLGIYQTQGGSLSSIAEDTVYISLPDDGVDGNTNGIADDCDELALPALPTGWRYKCVSAVSGNLRKADGTGWLPVNFSQFSSILGFKILPIDPINSASNQRYYSFVKGSWEVAAHPESAKYLLAASKDGGDAASYELGTNLKLSPILRTSFDMDTFDTTTLSHNRAAWKLMGGSAPTTSLSSDSQGSYLRVSGAQGWVEYQENIPFNPNAKYKISCRVRQVIDPTTGGKSIYCGVAGLASNGVAYINTAGSDNWTSQHYFAAAGHTLTAGSGYTTYTGYFKGHGTSAGGLKPDPNSPGRMHPGVAYIRPMFILNYNAGNGTADIESISLEIIE